jgi:hypothetical protein
MTFEEKCKTPYCQEKQGVQKEQYNIQLRNTDTGIFPEKKHCERLLLSHLKQENAKRFLQTIITGRRRLQPRHTKTAGRKNYFSRL